MTADKSTNPGSHSVQYSVVSDAEVPRIRRGRPSPWAGLPLATISEGAMISIPMTPEETKQRIAGLRTYVSRHGKKIGRRFSVRVLRYGIGIWRIE